MSLLSRRALLSGALAVLSTALLGANCGRFRHAVGPDEGVYVASRSGDTYHLKTCTVLKRIHRKNLLYYKTGDDAYKDGFRPCSICKPDSAGR